jgi:hypothetical protein
MLEQFIFENHLGQRFVGLDSGVYLNANDLRDYAWSYDTINSRISRFYRPITNRKLPLVVVGNTDADATRAKNRLLELAEADIEAKIPGKIYVGDYYTSGYITASAKRNYLIADRLTNIDLTLTSDDPAWYREQTHAFLPNTGSAIDIGGGTDFPYDYPYDYAVTLNGRNIVADTIGSNHFRLTIYGDAINPYVNIGGHVYAVNGAIGRGETLLIDSLNKTIVLTTASGSKINWFDKRSRVDYIFEPIPAGQSIVTWNGMFGFDLTVIEKRSEPKWT